MVQSINITKVYESNIENVFEAWTDPEKLKQWHAPGPMVTTNADVDLNVGGKYELTIEEPSGENQHIAMGEYREIVKPTKIVFTWSWKGAPAWAQESVVTINLKQLDDQRTELNLIHEFLPDEEQVASHTQGWEGVLAKLTDFLK